MFRCPDRFCECVRAASEIGTEFVRPKDNAGTPDPPPLHPPPPAPKDCCQTAQFKRRSVVLLI
jgi:hypothetical protein